MSLLKSMYKFVKAPIKDYCEKGSFRRDIRYNRYLDKPILENVILYESFHGQGMTDSPFAILKYFLKSEEYRELKHIVVLSNYDDIMKRGYEKYTNVKFVVVHSKEYLRYLATAKYLINNTSFPPYFVKRENQIYINTWHGTPLKYLGKHVKTVNKSYSCNLVKNFISADYLIHQNEYTTQIFNDTYELQDIYKGKILDIGYPRTDSILNTDRESIKFELEEFGIDFSKKLILYAPTWRGVVGKVENNIEKLYQDLIDIESKLSDEYQLVIKVHALQYKFLKNKNDLKKFAIIPNYMDINEVLSVIDILITDYSSVFFDFLITGRPIFYYMYDKQEYFSKIGSYIDLSENNLPGPICDNIDDLIYEINNIGTYYDKFKKIYSEFQNKYCFNMDGRNTEKIVDYIFRDNKFKIKAKTCYSNTKKHILLYAGGFLNNGITTSLINLLDHLDYEKYTVTIIENDKFNKIREENLKRLNPNVKLLFRNNGLACKFFENYRHRWILRFGIHNKISEKMYCKELYKREYRRIFGMLKFDVGIDYSGYVPFWSLIFSSNKENIKHTRIYQHNDMYEEYYKVIEGKFKHKDNLNLIFSLYKNFEKVVSVSKLTMENNMKNLKQFCKVDNFIYVNNVININNINKLKNYKKTLKIEDKDYLIINQSEKQDIISDIRIIENLDSNYINLVNIGRLSVEKDHKKLIQAFKKAYEEFKNLRLYIIGEGTLKNELNSLINNLGLQNSVFLVGQLSNPFYLLDKSDGFILSSNHEGQPMVLLEALALKKKIIATDIPANRDVLYGRGGKIVENSVEGLSTGIRMIVNNLIGDYEFDAEAYNNQALELIYKNLL